MLLNFFAKIRAGRGAIQRRLREELIGPLYATIR